MRDWRDRLLARAVPPRLAARMKGETPVAPDRLSSEDRPRPTGDRADSAAAGGSLDAAGAAAPAQLEIDPDELEAHADRAAAMLRSMGSKRRLLVLCNLVHGEKSVGELQRIIGLSQSALSQHLAVLRRMKLVQVRRSAQTIYYRLAGREVTAILATLYGIYCAPDGGACGVDAADV
jgi:DNA-binding transcriptional ArsR family regulator